MKKLLVLLMALFTLAQVDAQEKNVIFNGFDTRKKTYETLLSTFCCTFATSN